MNDPNNNLERENQMPFAIEHGQADVVSAGYFTPVARLVVQPALRTSGLLAALPDREAKSLLLLLTSLTANGRIEPTTAQIAGALRLPPCAVRSHMGKLTAFRWQSRKVSHGSLASWSFRILQIPRSRVRRKRKLADS